MARINPLLGTVPSRFSGREGRRTAGSSGVAPNRPRNSSGDRGFGCAGDEDIQGSGIWETGSHVASFRTRVRSALNRRADRSFIQPSRGGGLLSPERDVLVHRFRFAAGRNAVVVNAILEVPLAVASGIGAGDLERAVDVGAGVAVGGIEQRVQLKPGVGHARGKDAAVVIAHGAGALHLDVNRLAAGIALDLLDGGVLGAGAEPGRALELV